MKNIVAFTLCLVLASFVYAQNIQGIKFQNKLSWAEIQTKAKADHKYIFLDIYATWCGPCKVMENEVFNDNEVGNKVNQDFISVRIQIDSTSHDDAYVKSWYNDAKQIAKSNKVEGYPCFLFYSPDGNLLYKSMGYQGKDGFVSLVDFAKNSNLNDFRKSLDEYQKGNKDYSKMPDLILGSKELLHDYKLAFEIAKEYKENYLDKLSASEFLKKENIAFINMNGGVKLLNPNDVFFNIAYNQPKRIDSLLGNGNAIAYLKAIISSSEVHRLLYTNEIPVSVNPNWSFIEIKINKKYSKLRLSDFWINEKVMFYRNIKNWRLYTQFKSEQINKNPPKPGGMDVFFQLNSVAWDVFLNCKDRISLQRALEWSTLSIRLEENVQYYDTKANLLYKLGHIKHAIITEERALALEKENHKKAGIAYVDGEYAATLKKMENGEPTWVPGDEGKKP